MLPKKNRANKKDVEEIFQGGSFLNSPNLTFKFLIKKEKLEPKVSFIAPKAIAKKAVIRNKLRRLGYKALSKNKKILPFGFVGVFLFKKYQDDVLIIENETKTILNKIH